MKSMLYPKLAWQNLKNNRTTYFPYLLTCSVSVAMYYIMQSIAMNEGLLQVPGAAIALTIFFLGTVVVGVFCVALVFWTNSFLIKRRKKELGLYCVLGMERKHIAAMLLWETLYTAAICLVLGLGAGMLLSKLLFLGLLYMMDISTPIAFGIEPVAMLVTSVLFGIIFLCTLAYNLHHVRLAKPVELLRGGNVGEKEPRASWLLVVVGVLSLGWGYYIAVTVNEPLNALLLFFAAVLCVILGTFCLFTAGSIAFLKWLRRRKNFYYQPGHFISVSGMMYRMKQNAAGLAAICILFTMVLVTVSTTVCLYTGQSDMLRSLYPTDIRGSVTLEGGQNLEDVYQAVESAVQQSGSRVEQQFAWRACSSGNAVSMDENGVIRANRCLSQHGAADWRGRLQPRIWHTRNPGGKRGFIQEHRWRPHAADGDVCRSDAGGAPDGRASGRSRAVLLYLWHLFPGGIVLRTGGQPDAGIYRQRGRCAGSEPVSGCLRQPCTAAARLPKALRHRHAGAHALQRQFQGCIE